MSLHVLDDKKDAWRETGNGAFAGSLLSASVLARWLAYSWNFPVQSPHVSFDLGQLSPGRRLGIIIFVGSKGVTNGPNSYPGYALVGSYLCSQLSLAVVVGLSLAVVLERSRIFVDGW